MSTNQNNGQSVANKPFHKVRLGSIVVSLWKNNGQYGPMYSCTLQRTYVDSQGQFQNTQSIQQDDMLVAAKALEEAYRIAEHDKRESRAAAGPDANHADGGVTLGRQQAPRGWPQAEPQQPNQQERTVRMKLPDGRIVNIPSAQLAAMIEAGMQNEQQAPEANEYQDLLGGPAYTPRR